MNTMLRRAYATPAPAARHQHARPLRGTAVRTTMRWQPALDSDAPSEKLLGLMQSLTTKVGHSTVELEQRMEVEMQAKERLMAKLSAAQTEIAALRAQLQDERQDSDALRSIDQAHCYTQGVLYSQLRQRDQQMVALRLRLERVKRNPTCLDLESDPTIERDAISVVRDDYVKQLQHDNAELLNSLRQVQLRLEAAEAA